MNFLDRFLNPYRDPDPLPSPARLSSVNRTRRIGEVHQEAVQARAIDSFVGTDLTDMLLRVQGLTARPWRPVSIREALGVPAIMRAVTLISNTSGSLGIEAYRRGVRLSDDDTPRLIQRPDPFRIPRDFYRDTAYYMASRGEYWWWIAKRDGDGNALSLICIPPWEIKVEPNDRDRLRPVIKWLDREIPREDLRHGTFLPDESGYRGVGPLQLCGAATSVAVEAQEWAANFFASGNSNLLIKAAGILGEDPETGVSEADTLREQWMDKDSNTPRVVDDGIDDVKFMNANPQGAQMLDAREHQNGDAARMFGIPGSLLEYARPGSSLTYQNLEQEFTKFVKACLVPDYLEPIEQQMSDLLPRSTVARFNVRGFQRADVKTRWEVYKLAVDVLGQEEAANLAREAEGIVPGDVEYAPIPLAPPQAVPALLPIQARSSDPVRCDGTRMLRGILKPCNYLLAEAGPFVGRCRRCGKEHSAAA